MAVFYQQHICQKSPHYFKYLKQQSKTPSHTFDKKMNILCNFLFKNDDYTKPSYLRSQLKCKDSISYYSHTFQRWINNAMIQDIHINQKGKTEVTITYQFNGYVGKSKKKITSSSIRLNNDHKAPNLICIITKNEGEASKIFNHIKNNHNAAIYRSSQYGQIKSQLLHQIHRHETNIIIFQDYKQNIIPSELFRKFNFVFKWTDKVHGFSYLRYHTLLKHSGKLIKFPSFIFKQRISLQYIKISLHSNYNFINDYVNNLNRTMKLQIPLDIIFAIRTIAQDNLINVINKCDIIMH